jgi:hypothetical protein
MSEPKVYVGKGKAFGEYGNIKLSINVNDMDGNRVLVPNEKGWLNLIIGKMRQPDARGNEYTVWRDDFKPKQRAEAEEQPFQDSMPF